MERTSHTQLRESEETEGWKALRHKFRVQDDDDDDDDESLICNKGDLLTFGACWILGFCRNRVISAFSAFRRWNQKENSQNIKY